MDANLAALLIALPTTIDPNLATLLGLIVTSFLTSLTTIILAIINWKKSSALKDQSTSIEQKVDAGNAVTTETHAIANGRTESLMRQLEEKNQRIEQLSLLVPAPPPDSADKP